MKKTLNIAKTVLVWLVVVTAVFMMLFTVVSVTIFNRNDRNLFGYKMYIVNTDSMAKTDFDAGDLVFVKEVDPSTLKDGDIITFLSQNEESFGKILTHKIRRTITDSDGDRAFVTYGTTTDNDDKVAVTYPYILGKYDFHIVNLGTFFNFMKTTTGYFVCIFVPFMLLILYQGINFFNVFKKYKNEQVNAMKAEREKIEKERAENARMLKELKELQAKMNAEKNERRSDSDTLFQSSDKQSEE